MMFILAVSANASISQSSGVSHVDYEKTQHKEQSIIVSVASTPLHHATVFG